MNKTNHVRILRRIGACSEAVQFASQYPSATKAWRACKRGDWLLWFAGRMAGAPESKSRKKPVLAACKCARLALPIYEKRCPNDSRVRDCIKTTEMWALGEGGVTIEDVSMARTYAADAAGAAGAAYAAAYAAYAAAYAADAAAYAADAARQKILLKCARLVRKYYPVPPKKSR